MGAFLLALMWSSPPPMLTASVVMAKPTDTTLMWTITVRCSTSATPSQTLRQGQYWNTRGGVSSVGMGPCSISRPWYATIQRMLFLAPSLLAYMARLSLGWWRETTETTKIVCWIVKVFAKIRMGNYIV